MRHPVAVPMPVEAHAQAGSERASESALMTLQRHAGNQAMARALTAPGSTRTGGPHAGQRASAGALRALLRHGPARKPPPATAAEGRSDAVAERRDVAGEPVRVFEGPASRRAATRLGAYAYTWNGDVFLGEGIGQPGAPSRDDALRHELRHVRQARRPGARAAPQALEAEAHRGGDRLAADPEQPLGWWFVIPLAAGAYVLLRPNTANAPSPEDVEQGRLVESTSEVQVAGEALALFAVPAGVAGWLARAGYGVVASMAVSGAASAVSYRGVQDVGAGEFSGVEAYVVDATTGAVIGVVIGGTFRAIGGPGALGPRQQPGRLIHLTDEAGQAGIQGEQVLRGSQGIYAVPESVAAEGTLMRTMRTLLRPSQTSQVVPLPQAAGGAFTQPVPLGPVSAYQRLMGVYRAPAGGISTATGAFTPGSARILPNVTGQFWPYGVDAMLWVGAMAVSPASESAEERGLAGLGLPTLPYAFRGLLEHGEPPPITTRSDGPFVVVPPPALGLTDPQDVASAATQSTFDPVAQVCLPPEEANQSVPEPTPQQPAIILVAPMTDLPQTPSGY